MSLSEIIACDFLSWKFLEYLETFLDEKGEIVNFLWSERKKEGVGGQFYVVSLTKRILDIGKIKFDFFSFTSNFSSKIISILIIFPNLENC